MSAELETMLNNLNQLSFEELLTLQEQLTRQLRVKASSNLTKEENTEKLDWQTASAEEIIASIRANRVERNPELSL